MPPAIIAAIVGAAGVIGGAEIASNTTQGAAQTNTAAQDYAAMLQAQAAQNTLGFEEQQAGQTQGNFIASQNANYNQWLYRQGIVRPYQGEGLQAENTLGQMLGLPAIDTSLPAEPAAPTFTTTPPPAPTPIPSATPTAAAQPSRLAQGIPAAPPPSGASAPTATASGNPMDPNYIASQLQAVYSSLGVQPTGPGTGPTDIAYYTQKVEQTGGWTGGNAAYWTSRIGQDLAAAKSPQAASTSTTSSPTLGTMATGTPPTPPAPAGTSSLPFLPTDEGTLASYLVPNYGATG